MDLRRDGKPWATQRTTRAFEDEDDEDEDDDMEYSNRRSRLPSFSGSSLPTGNFQDTGLTNMFDDNFPLSIEFGNSEQKDLREIHGDPFQ